MSGELVDRRQLVADSVADFGGLAFETIHQLQREVRQLREENERLGQELAWAEAQYEEVLRELREAL